MAKAGKLNAQQRLFADHYLIYGNATRAAKAAGYADAGAHVQGSRLLRVPKVAAYLDKIKDERNARLRFKADDVLNELAKIAGSDLSDLVNEDGTIKSLHEIPADHRRALAGIEVDEVKEFNKNTKSMEVVGIRKKVKLWDKIKALELLGKHLKLYTDKIELDVTDALADRLTKAQERLNAPAKPEG